MARPERSILIAGASILVLVVVTVVVALTVGARGPDEFPAGSPADVLQRYLDALRDRDVDLALTYVSERVRADLEADEFQKRSLYTPDLEQRRIRVDRTEEQGDRATLYVTVEWFSGSGIDADRYSYERQIPFIREGGAWKIDEILYGL